MTVQPLQLIVGPEILRRLPELVVVTRPMLERALEECGLRLSTR